MENTMCQETVAQWERFELRLPGPIEDNPYVDVEWSVIFRHEEKEITSAGFYAGDGLYITRSCLKSAESGHT